MWSGKFYLLTFGLVILSKLATCDDESVVWRWSCEDGACKKQRADSADGEAALSLEACKMFCYENGLLWPKPSGPLEIGNYLSKINFNDIKFEMLNPGKSKDLLEAAGQRFKEMVRTVLPQGVSPKASGKSLQITVTNKQPDVQEFSLDMDESYELQVAAPQKEVVSANIIANTFFGARHALETLSQLIVFDDVRNHLLIVRDANVTDRPAYPYRGLLLDTARNYYSVDSIKATINAMAAVKLNTFHWHITDSHSFPFVSERRRELSRLGALNPNKVYTMETISEIVKYGLERGVRVLPEFDAPAHVGEGWQDTDLTACFNYEPWSKYCVEPPCGQLDPTKSKLYDYLADIYADMAESFQPDLFHMGGDEVSFVCWNSSANIQQFLRDNKWGLNKSGFLKLWNYFQEKAQEKAYKAFGKKVPLILWTSTLTEYLDVDKYLNKDDYIIQVWTTGSDPQIKGLLEKGYRLIMSNYDALYLDCGFSAWVGAGNNWCSPYIGWQKVYDNNFSSMKLQYDDQILGGEAALWSEQSDTATLDGRLWPRAAAFAERLWSDPRESWTAALDRMLHMRERLVRMGIQADSIQPEWCYQNDGHCRRD